jgi:ATP-dependent Lon protease
MALISLLTRKPALREVALSGELTLSGRVLPASGIREKILAAQRAGVKKIIFPEANRIDIDSLDADLREGVDLFLTADVFSIPDKVLK